jgi:hypothetical protein
LAKRRARLISIASAGPAGRLASDGAQAPAKAQALLMPTLTDEIARQCDLAKLFGFGDCRHEQEGLNKGVAGMD